MASNAVHLHCTQLSHAEQSHTDDSQSSCIIAMNALLFAYVLVRTSTCVYTWYNIGLRVGSVTDLLTMASTCDSEWGQNDWMSVGCACVGLRICANVYLQEYHRTIGTAHTGARKPSHLMSLAVLLRHIVCQHELMPVSQKAFQHCRTCAWLMCVSRFSSSILCTCSAIFVCGCGVCVYVWGCAIVIFTDNNFRLLHSDIPNADSIRNVHREAAVYNCTCTYIQFLPYFTKAAASFSHPLSLFEPHSG